MSDIQNESLARELARATISRTNLFDRIPAELRPLVMECIVEVTHEALETGEANAAILDDSPSKLEHYTLGYLHGITDKDDTFNIEQGEF